MPTINTTIGDTFSLRGGDVVDALLFPNLTSLTGPMTITDCPLLTSIVFSLAPIFGNTTLTFKNNALSQATMDHILLKVNANGTNNGTLDLSGVTNADPSFASIPDIEGLLARGWTILFPRDIRITQNLLVRITQNNQIRILT